MPTENKTPVTQQPKRNGTSIVINVVALVIIICASFATGIIVANALHSKPGDARNPRQSTQQQIPNNTFNNRGNNQRRQNRQKPTTPKQKEEKDSEEQKES